ncbi:MAG: mandelate racemase/muconate lactonizing enzyme family protein [Bryobacterales bacterium]
MPSRLTRREILTIIAAAAGGSRLREPLLAAESAVPASARSSKIVKAEVIHTRVPMHERVRDAWQRSFKLQDRYQTHYEPVIIKLHSDEGLVGIGDADMPAGRAKAIAESLVGHSPWEYLLDDSLGGVLVAVYDLLGKTSGMSVARLFSTSPRDKIVQTWWSQCFPPALMASEAKMGYDLGYRVHKVKARPWEDPYEQGQAICDVIGSDMRVWADANSWWRSVGRTRHIGEQMAKLPNYFAIESPFARSHVDDYRALKPDFPLQLAEHMPDDPMPFVRDGLLSAFVVGKPMGRGFAQKALMAEVTGIPLWVEHSISSGVNQVFQAHQNAAFPGVEYTISITHVLADDLMRDPFQMHEGFYHIPDKPGLGVELDDDAIDNYRV